MKYTSLKVTTESIFFVHIFSTSVTMVTATSPIGDNQRMCLSFSHHHLSDTKQLNCLNLIKKSNFLSKILLLLFLQQLQFSFQGKYKMLCIILHNVILQTKFHQHILNIFFSYCKFFCLILTLFITTVTTNSIRDKYNEVHNVHTASFSYQVTSTQLKDLSYQWSFEQTDRQTDRCIASLQSPLS